MELMVKLPTSLKDIKLREYNKYSALDFKDKDEEYLRSNLIDIFYGISYEKYKKLKSYDVNLMINNVTNLLSIKECPLIRTFKLRGLEFGFIPNLDDITFGELIDLESSKNIQDTMAILYRPIIKKRKDKYAIEEYEAFTKYNTLFLDMPLDVVYGSLFFFINLNLEIIKYIEKFTIQEGLTQKRSLRLPKSGPGIRASSNAQVET